MSEDRREFLSKGLFGSLMAFSLNDVGLMNAQTLGGLFQDETTALTDEATRNFWLYSALNSPWRDQFSPAAATTSAGRPKASGTYAEIRKYVQRQAELMEAPESATKMTNAKTSLDSNREPYFFYYDRDRKSFRRASEIEDSELLDADDAQATFSVTGFRPSIADRELFANISGGYLRVDLQQQVPMAGLLEALAWTATAVLLPDQNKKLPPLNTRFDLGKSWGDFQSVLFPRGIGSWRWNFMVQEKESWWRQVLGLLGKLQGPLLGGLIAPLGLPAMAISAFTQFNSIYANLISQNARTKFVVQSQDLPMVSTKAARQSLQISTVVPVRTGAYIIVPRQNADAFSASMKNFRIAQGYVIDNNRADEVAASRDAVPEVTYLTLEVGVKKPSYTPVSPKTK